MFADQRRTALLLKAIEHSCEEEINIHFRMKLTQPFFENYTAVFLFFVLQVFIKDIVFNVSFVKTA